MKVYTLSNTKCYPDSLMETKIEVYKNHTKAIDEFYKIKESFIENILSSNKESKTIEDIGVVIQTASLFHFIDKYGYEEFKLELIEKEIL